MKLRTLSLPEQTILDAYFPRGGVEAYRYAIDEPMNRIRYVLYSEVCGRRCIAVSGWLEDACRWIDHSRRVAAAEFLGTVKA